MKESKTKSARWQRKVGRAVMITLVITLVIAVAGGITFSAFDYLLLQPVRIRSEQIAQWQRISAKIELGQEEQSWKHWFLSPRDCRFVKYLVLKDGRQIDADVKALMQHEKLEGLVLHGPKVTTSHIAMLRSHPSLRLICAIGTEVDNDKLLADESSVEVRYMKLPPIARMDEQQIRYTTRVTPVNVGAEQEPEISDALTAMIREPLLQRIDMRNVLVDRDTIEAMAKAEVCEVLWVGYGFDDSMADLLPEFEFVSYLDLSQSMITDVGIKEVLKMPRIKRLVLGPNMTDATMAVLSKSKTIKEFNCNDSQVGDQGVIAMQDSTSLTSITLSGRLITGKAMDALTQYKQLSDLRVSGCIHLKDRDLDKIFQMKKLKTVAMDVSDREREKIQRVLPKLEILGGLRYGD